MAHTVHNAWSDEARAAAAEARAAAAKGKSLDPRAATAKGPYLSGNVVSSEEAHAATEKAAAATVTAESFKQHVKAGELHQQASSMHQRASFEHLRAGNVEASQHHDRAALAHTDAAIKHHKEAPGHTEHFAEEEAKYKQAADLYSDPKYPHLSQTPTAQHSVAQYKAHGAKYGVAKRSATMGPFAQNAEYLVANFVGAPVRREKLDGREYLVVSARMIVPGVLSGSKGPLLYPPDHCENSVPLWDGMPIVLEHPYDPATGMPMSAEEDGVWDRQGLGKLRNTSFNGSLDAEAWFDVQRVKKLDPPLLGMLERGEKVELSTGLGTVPISGPGKHTDGRGYIAAVGNYAPDHLAVIRKGRGACSIDDGCGFNVNAEKCPACGGEMVDGECQQCGYSEVTENKRSIWRKLGEFLGVLSPTHNDWSDAAREAAALARKGGHSAAKGSYHGDSPRAHEIVREESTPEAVKQDTAHALQRGAAAGGSPHDKAIAATEDSAKLTKLHKKASDYHFAKGKGDYSAAGSAHMRAGAAHLRASSSHGVRSDPGLRSYWGIKNADAEQRSARNQRGVAMDRESTVEWLVANCDCWKGKAALLGNEELFSDEDIENLRKDTEKHKQHELTANAASKVGSLKGGVFVVNAKGDDDDDDDDDEEQTDNQWLEKAPPQVRSAVANSIRIVENRKKELIGKLTANAANAEAAAAVYAKLDVSQLEALLAKEAPANNDDIVIANYLGNAGGPQLQKVPDVIAANHLPLPTTFPAPAAKK